MSAKIEVTGDVAGLLSLDRQIQFAAATALTAAAKEGQRAALRAVEDTFTTRGDWYKPENRFGVRVTPATKASLVSAVRTAADWLAKHETGGTKTPTRGVHIAIPTSKVRANKKQRISRALRPANIRDGFIVTRRDGEIWLYRRAARSGYPIVPMYRLVKRARIEKQSTIIEPAERAIDRHLVPDFHRALERAIATAK